MATTGRYNTIQLGSLYFTTDGTSAGFPCKSEVSGLEKLLLPVTGQIIDTIDGEPIMQNVQPAKGAVISTKFSVLEQSVLFSLVSAVTAAVTGSTTQTLTLTEGAFGDFVLTVYPNLPDFISAPGDFYLTKTKEVTFNWKVKAIGRLLTASPGTLTLTAQSATLTQG